MTTNETPSVRIQWLDIARSFAIAAVVLCHVDERAYGFFAPDVMVGYSLQSEVFGVLSFAVARMGVPFFLFLTGYLLLTRHYDNGSCRLFWKRRWIPLLICVEAWNLLYTLFLAAMGQDLTIGVLLRNLLFLQNVNINHIWYLPMILGFYLLVPVMAMALERLEPKTLAFPLAVLFAIAFVVPTFDPIAKAFGHAGVASVISTGFSGGMCGVYMLLGWAVAKGAFKRASSLGFWLGAAFSVAALALIELWLFSKGVSYFLWYSNGLLAVASLCLFELLSRVERPLPCARAIESLSRQSFAVYLVHYPLLMLAWPYFGLVALPLPVKVVGMTAALLLASWLVSALVSKIPLVGPLLLYQRSDGTGAPSTCRV